MGITNSKSDKNAALCLCRERKRFIKQAIDSRYALAASHVSYINSLRNIGIALRRYAEAEVVIESPLSTSDKTPSHSSYPSPSPSPKISGSPMHNERPVSPPGAATLSYMRSGGSAAVTMRFNPVSTSYVDEDIPLPPPPPPMLEADSSWDYFDPIDAEESESFRFVGNSEVDVNCDDIKGWRQMRSEEANPSVVGTRGRWAKGGLHGNIELHEGTMMLEQRSSEVSGNSGTQNGSVEHNANPLNSGGGDGSLQTGDGEARQLVVRRRNANEASKREKSMSEKDLCAEREDPSEFITHRAKDFLSSIKDIENRFFRASESGREVSRMLESNKIRVGYSEAKGNYLCL